METTIEQRTENRTTVTWPVSIWLPPNRRVFKCANDRTNSGGPNYRDEFSSYGIAGEREGAICPHQMRAGGSS